VLETPHVVVGAAIAYKVGNPALALPLALGSHFVLEKIPHWNPHLNTEKKKLGHISSNTMKVIFIDSTIALFCGIFIASLAYPDLTRSAIIILASFLSTLPDLIEAPYFFLNNNNVFIKKWIHFQKTLQVDTGIIPGLITQFITIFAAFWWIIG
jgi:hypothetical protein